MTGWLLGDVDQAEQRQGGGEEDVFGERDMVGLLRGVPAEGLRCGGDRFWRN